MRIDQLFTRQEMALLTGIADDVLAFWIKSGLLVASSGGAGKGSHRKFTGHQVNIAGVLAELRNFGINLAGLRSFAKQLQRGTALCESAECNFASFHEAMELRWMADELKAHRPVRVWGEDGEDRLAKDVKDIIRHFDSDPRYRQDTLANILAFAARIAPEERAGIRLFESLNAHGYGSGGSDEIWLAVRLSEEEWEIFTGSENAMPSVNDGRTFRSGIHLWIGNIVADVWGRRLTPITFEYLPLSDEDKAKVATIEERAQRFSAESSRAHAAAVLRAAKANAEKLGLGDQ